MTAMGFFHKKPDPISDRARALNSEIAALEAEIKKLSSRVEVRETPKVRSTALPQGSAVPANPFGAPIFEKVDQNRIKAPTEFSTRGHFNELGVRKYDLAAFFRRFRNHFRTQPASNPKLVNYLAAGSIQGLRPLRYEKRVARNRFIFLSCILLLVLWWIIAVFVR
jgi:hypothetical protein